MTRLGVPTDAELVAEAATASAERRAEIQTELEEREQLRASMRGHDPSLCQHPVLCHAGRIRRAVS
jgi:hypothetical protein